MVIDPGNNVNTQNTVAGKSRQQSAVKTDQAVSTDSKASDTASTDSVSLSAASVAMTQLETKIATSSEIDSAKVADIKAQLEAGTYQIDPDAIADKILAQEKALG